eukprot:TRINITY_DN5717_c0_g1_i6.p1 TRINITY_DN5717_c0_g1~~TRINITY_DN5717_c0_g1_i6.p1  ORF type:complete len:701 (-),score=122.00 TRINITY_DN5717_c0_g1_i6:51-2153(-)
MFGLTRCAIRCRLSSYRRLYTTKLSQAHFIQNRLDLWTRLEHNIAKEHQGSINVLLPDGTTKEIPKGTTPHTVALSISNKLARNGIVASVNGILQDLNTQLEEDSRLEILTYDTPEGRTVFWHSCAHILGQAIETFYESKGIDVFLADGPALLDSSNGGFFYEFMTSDQQFLTNSDLVNMLEICTALIKENQDFKKLFVDRSTAMQMFSYNPLKIELIGKIPCQEKLSIYKCGKFVDLCRGPHIRNTGMVKAFDLLHSAASHHKDHKYLQRVYGIGFPEKEMYKEWKTVREAAEARDHKVIGKDQKLFIFSHMSPGGVFFLPHGTRIYNKLVDFIREMYVRFGYSEVITPNLFKNDLWKISGHWDHYKDDMFFVQEGQGIPSCSIEDPSYDLGLKPMNCPGHCLIFQSSPTSWRDLPIRLADFSALHRNEASGALKGLTRLRRFCQDDAHIFCRVDQISLEISNSIQFLKFVYDTLGFDYRVVISTRPQSFLGEISQWECAEKSLETCLQENNIQFSVNPGDGAFYGPKIDVMVRDALMREHQCGTIQLDFQLPKRFGLNFTNFEGNSETPVMIHRAIFGSIERMMGILMEHVAGRWPLWLSPRQVVICTVSDTCTEFAKNIQQIIKTENFYVDLNLEGETIQKKIRVAQQAKYNYILVLGNKEVQEGKVNVRTRDNVVHGTKTIHEFIQELKMKVKNYE